MNQPLFGKQIIRLDTTPSTQELLKDKFREGAQEGVIVLASEQSQGKGRMNRSWNSARGKGLWMSVLLKPDGPESMWGWVPLWAGVAVRRAVVDTIKPEISAADLKLKWPNDVYWQDRKLVGILAEVVRDNSHRAVVLGLGINLLQVESDFPYDISKRAVSIYQMTGKRIDSEHLLESTITAFNEMASMIKPIDAGSIRELWLESAWALGGKLRIVCGDTAHQGKFVGLGEYGEIGLQTEDNTIEYIAATDDIQKLYHP